MNRYIFTVLTIFLCNPSIAFSDFILPDDSITIGVFIFDFNSGQFEGGYIKNYEECGYNPRDAECHCVLSQHRQETDTGIGIDLTEPCSGGLVFSSNSLATGYGQISVPGDFLAPDSFPLSNTVTQHPDWIDWFDPFWIEEDYGNLYDVLIAPTWQNIEALNVVNEMMFYQTYLVTFCYLQTIQSEQNDYSEAKTVLILYRTPNLRTPESISPSQYPENSVFDIKAYPNPFNLNTKIVYQLSQAGEVSIRFDDILGRSLAIEQIGYRNAGTHTHQYSGINNMSGVVIYSLNVSNRTVASGNLVIIK